LAFTIYGFIAIFLGIVAIAFGVARKNS